MNRNAREVIVRMGEYAVAHNDTTLAALGLGSCVAMALSDPVARVGALIHVLLPSQSLSHRTRNPARSPDTALPLALDGLVEAGAERGRLRARLIGGATMFADLLPAGSVHMGERNLVACRSALRDAGIPLVAEAVGGKRGRSVWFDIGADTVTVRTAGGESQLL